VGQALAIRSQKYCGFPFLRLKTRTDVEIETWIARVSTSIEVIRTGEAIFRERARLMQGRSHRKWEDGLIAQRPSSSPHCCHTRCEGLRAFSGAAF
jgi:hypothetical protein